MKHEITEVVARIKTEVIPFPYPIVGKWINFIAWVDGDEERWPSATGDTPEAATATLAAEIKELIEMEED